eukprot:SAG11_NODE_2936_length_2825_cov_2.224138_3_plen_108_part_00
MLLLLLLLLLLLAGGAPVVHGLDNGLGRTPPLGWSGFNFFAFQLNESIMLETADALVSTGLAKLGFGAHMCTVSVQPPTGPAAAVAYARPAWPHHPLNITVPARSSI